MQGVEEGAAAAWGLEAGNKRAAAISMYAQQVSTPCLLPWHVNTMPAGYPPVLSRDRLLMNGLAAQYHADSAGQG